MADHAIPAAAPTRTGTDDVAPLSEADTAAQVVADAATASLAKPPFLATPPTRPVPAAGPGAEHMWMKTQQLWMATRGSLAIGLAVLLALLLLAWLLRRRRRAREDAPLRVLFPAHAAPPRGPADTLDIPDWLHASAAPASAAAQDYSAADPVAAAAPIASAAASAAAQPSQNAVRPPAPVSLPDWKPDPGKGAMPLNLRGPAAAALTVNGTPVVARAGAPAEAPLSAALVAPVAVATERDPERDPDFARARALLGQDRPAEALALLKPLLRAGANAETWAVAGWCHWKLANEQGDPQAAREAARAFERAISADPSRALPLARMIGRCHLLQAAADAPERRAAHVGEAVRVFEAHFVGAPRLSPSALLEWAEALLEMARLAAPAQQPMWLGRLDAVLAAGGSADAALAPRWHRLRAAAATLQARHAGSPAEHARLLRSASAELQAGCGLLEDAQEREQWLAEWIDTERQPLASGSTAARIAGYQALERRMLPPLAAATTAAPLLAWVRVLADWAALLDGPAARQRLASTGAWFDRIDGLGDLGAGDRAFTRAYYLRLRARHEHGAARGRTLDEAGRLLASVAASGQERDPAVAMERAEIALARAEAAADPAHYREAIEHASLAADHPQTRLPGFRALLAGLLGWQRLASEAPRLAQIEVVANWLREAEGTPGAPTLRLLARAALAGGDPAAAAELGARAWQAGLDDHDLIACWQQADALWARELAQDSDRTAWQRQHRLLRLASSTA